MSPATCHTPLPFTKSNNLKDNSKPTWKPANEKGGATPTMIQKESFKLDAITQPRPNSWACNHASSRSKRTRTVWYAMRMLCPSMYEFEKRGRCCCFPFDRIISCTLTVCVPSSRIDFIIVGHSQSGTLSLPLQWTPDQIVVCVQNNPEVKRKSVLFVGFTHSMNFCLEGQISNNKAR